MATFARGRDSAADEPVPGADGDAAGGAAKRKRSPRLSARERRADLLEAAVVEFAENGYHGTRTADIAARAGVSQPYVYALFPDKRALFLACHDWTTEQIKEALEKASADLADDDDVEQALDRAYEGLFSGRPHQVLFQMQAHAAAAADPAIREPVRRRFIELVELSERLHGGSRDLVLRHVARSMLGNVALALDLPPEYRPIG
ncbi:MAG: TetR/AcrR family transcriptional regulator [Trebonia sp.]